jgi:hypothetical protein
MKRHRAQVTLVVTLLLGSWAGAQAPAGQSAANITFAFNFPGATPSQYQISVGSDGRGEYQSSGGDPSPQRLASPFAASSSRNGDGTEDPGAVALAEPYRATFSVSSTSRERIFSLAAAARYFNGAFDYKKKHLANTGQKTLAYSDGIRRHQATYNYSTNESIAQLTAFFQQLSTTLETGRRLQYLYDHARLGLDEELKRASELHAGGQLTEIEVLAPILQRIAGDPAIMHVARQHAQKLLAQAASPASSK